MLTQDQLEQLEPLTQHPKYGKILIDAIDIWKREDVIPTSRTFGVISEKEFFDFSNPNKKQCCLLGASLIGYKAVDYFSETHWCRIYESLIKKYSISNSEINDIWEGFDIARSSSYSTEAYDFGKHIRKIIDPLEEMSY